MRRRESRLGVGEKMSRREKMMEKEKCKGKETGDSEGGEGSRCRGGRQTGSSREGRG